jgi:hypothetical protein
LSIEDIPSTRKADDRSDLRGRLPRRCADHAYYSSFPGGSRFLLHVLPSGFVKIRHFGLLANRNRLTA